MRSWLCVRLSMLLAAAFLAGGAQAASGPHPVTTGAYQFFGVDEPLVATDRKIDLWARVYRPADLPAKSLPLVVFLHGNHYTCRPLVPNVSPRNDYTFSGQCPDDFEVMPSHRGYDYLAEELASRGYLVASINANRGINGAYKTPGDKFLVLMRGRLILRHLMLLSEWNRGKGSYLPPETLGFDPKGAIDFSQVGLVGHGRAGEGTRVALQKSRTSKPFIKGIGPMTIRSIFEISPLDFERAFSADGVNSMILLPSCSGDIKNYEGMRVFDRAFTRGEPVDQVPAIHGTIAVWGANHNLYNSEWYAEYSSCSGTPLLALQPDGAERQRATAFETVIPFIRATVGADANPALAARFDPTVKLPKSLSTITKYDRGYLPGPINADTVLLERFMQPTGVGDSGLPTTTVGAEVTHGKAGDDHDFSQRVARVRWDASSPPERYFQTNLATEGRDLSGFKTFAFRVALRCYGTICSTDTTKNLMDVTVSLVAPDGSVSTTLHTAERVRLGRPVGFSTRHMALYTVSIPLEEFGPFDLTKVAGVRFGFDQRPEGLLALSDLTVSTIPIAGGGSAADEPEAATTAARSAPPVRPTSTRAADGNLITVVRRPLAAGAREHGAVEIVLKSKRAFAVTDAAPTLDVGGAAIVGGDISPDGRTIVFETSEPDYAALKPGAEVTLDMLAGAPIWKFGPLPK